MFAALQGTAFLSTVSLGKGGLGRLTGASEERQELWLWRGAGVDPMFPGLTAAAALWAAELYRAARGET